MQKYFYIKKLETSPLKPIFSDFLKGNQLLETNFTRIISKSFSLWPILSTKSSYKFAVSPGVKRLTVPVKHFYDIDTN